MTAKTSRTKKKEKGSLTRQFPTVAAAAGRPHLRHRRPRDTAEREIKRHEEKKSPVVLVVSERTSHRGGGGGGDPHPRLSSSIF